MLILSSAIFKHLSPNSIKRYGTLCLTNTCQHLVSSRPLSGNFNVLGCYLQNHNISRYSRFIIPFQTLHQLQLGTISKEKYQCRPFSKSSLLNMGSNTNSSSIKYDYDLIVIGGGSGGLAASKVDFAMCNL